MAATRDGFDLRDHTLSRLTNGDLSWVQVLNFVLAGALFAAAAYGFPPGTPGGAPESMRLHGALHVVVGGIGFLALSVAFGWASLLLARRPVASPSYVRR